MKPTRLSFHDEIQKNKISSYLLITIILAVLLLLTYTIAYAIGGDYFFIILIIGIPLSIGYIVFGFYNSDKIAIKSANAKPANGPEYRQYHNIVEGLCIASGLPKPKLYVMHEQQINAFASGRDPKNAVICVTDGSLQKLTKQELEGVLAHELSHIANYDIRFMTLTAVLVGMIAIISEIFLRSLFWSSIGGSHDRENNNVVLMIIGIALAILAPIIVALVQLAISRKREYAADSSAVKFMRTPTGLIGALTKIKDNQPIKVSGAVAPLFLAKPSKAKEWFSTHPPLAERIAKLQRM
ncbi:M48 family metallopeptidase [Candidatus Pacearchaeota archaeon]|nr:M48 family metallopeptidase [Candidatus Pacearchaeota archaeon]